jgi:hypothetical protein
MASAAVSSCFNRMQARPRTGAPCICKAEVGTGEMLTHNPGMIALGVKKNGKLLCVAVAEDSSCWSIIPVLLTY